MAADEAAGPRYQDPRVSKSGHPLIPTFFLDKRAPKVGAMPDLHHPKIELHKQSRRKAFQIAMRVG
jgi:hypothetical protein